MRNRKTLQILIAVIFVLSTFGIMPSSPTATAQAQPILVELAAEEPGQMVRVIAQKMAGAQDVEALVAKLGGRVVSDLSIINAFAVEMTAEAALELAQSDAVRWVSLDAPVRSASLQTQSETLLDRFSVRQYSNNDGSQAWLGDWIEFNDDGESDGGKVKIDKDQLKLEDKNRGIQRSADLSMADTATLSFDYRRDKLDKPAKYVNLEISTDGGTTWIELYRFQNGKDSDMLPFSVDITPYRTENTTIRFLTSPDDAGKLYVDNFEIAYSYQYDDGDVGGGGDDPVNGTECSENAYTVRDEFNSGAYSGNDGSNAWASDWVELDDREDPAQDPTVGLVKVVNGELSLHNLNYDDPNPGVQRAVDFTGSIACAKLSFDFHTSSQVGIADSIAVEISPDGGANFIILDTIDWIDGAVSDSRVYDITPFATPETVIRIRVEQFYGLDGREFFADNIQVSYSFGPEVPRCNVQTVADGFQAYPYTYENNSGTRNWLTPWVEVGENDGPISGDVSIVNDTAFGRVLKIWETYTDGSWDAVDGIWRTADISGASSARLSFLYSRTSMTADDYLSVEASTDGGATWDEVGRVAGGGTSNVSTSDEGWRYAEFDLSDFISTNTGIRLASNFVHDDYWDKFYISDVKITFDDPCSDMPPNTYLETLGVPQVWDMGIDGSGVTVAVIDSGIAMDDDFSTVPGESGSERLTLQLGFNPSAYTEQDIYGHGTHVAGIIGGNGTKSDGYYKGIAPGVNLISMKISNDYGMSYESDVVAGMQWVYENKDLYNIRVVNLSLNSTVPMSYHESPMNAAAEILWFNGVVVVVSAGNADPNLTYETINSAPANDPFVITVGAADEKGTTKRIDDVATSFSAWGNTYDSHLKPDIYAPGKNIVSVLAASSWWRNDHPDRFVDGGYFKISGTSMAAPMVTGAVALLLQAEPDLNPDQVKYRLTHSNGWVSGWKYLDVYAMLTTPTTEHSNQGIMPSLLLATGPDAIDFASVGWNTVGWNTVGWNTVGWNTVGWNTVGWNTVGWNTVGWNSTYFGE